MSRAESVKVADYDVFVRRTDQYKERAPAERREISLYGLVGEIGSVCSAIKKKLLAESGIARWDQPSDEVVEEIGDVVWYCFSLAQIENASRSVNILTNDIALLKREMSGKNERAKKIHAALDASESTKKERFLLAAETFPSTKQMTFDHYQSLAFLTARTSGRDLLEVCVAVLWQLGAELLRKTLPSIELTINRNVADREVNVVLGEIAWHLCAVASLFRLSMNDVVSKNVEKVSFRSDRKAPTPLHDLDREPHERFPRTFEISFVTIGRGRSRMYLHGRRLGDDLTANSYDSDGYQFHDVLHLASLAHLGWSPVLRKLLGLKRKSRDDRVDEVEDGARAQIVEELVQKAIHTEGERLVNESGRCGTQGIPRAFSDRSHITFRFLKTLRGFVAGLEVWKNQYWEWEDAIFNGSELYYQLRLEQQGTVSVDLESRAITFSPDVFVDLRGASVGLGVGRALADIDESELATILTSHEKSRLSGPIAAAKTVAAKRAMLKALRIPEHDFCDLDIKLLDDRRVCFKARGDAQRRIWEAGVISFQIAFSHSESFIDCTAIAIADVHDLD